MEQCETGFGVALLFFAYVYFRKAYIRKVNGNELTNYIITV